MILTVTPDPVLDRILFIERWTPDVPMHAQKMALGVGGKGLDASLVLAQLSVETIGLTFLAGETGRALLQLTETYGLAVEATWTGGETRTAYVIAETDRQRHSHIFTGGLRVEEGHAAAFRQHFSKRVRTASWVICGGIIPATLPSAFYGEMSQLAREAGVPLLVDSFGAFITGALPQRPDIVKMNRREFEWTFGEEAPDVTALRERAAHVYEKFDLAALVITCGADGILAFSSEGVHHARPPRLRAVNATGAGDAASAALAWRFEAGDNWPQALHWAAAVSAAVVLTEATAECRREDVDRLYPDVVVETLS